MTDHPLLSSTIIEKIFFDIKPGGEPVWLIEVMQAIKAHHTKSRDDWTQLLKRADNEARNMEIAEINKQLSVKEWNEWFNTDGLIKLLSEYINVPQPNGKLRAFSLRDVVYCSPDYVVDAALRLAYLKRVRSPL